jgi:hypothetical protein
MNPAQLIDASIQYGKHFRQKRFIALRNALRAAGTKVNGFNLFNHYKTGQFAALWNRHMKGKASIGVGNRAHDGDSGASIE